MAIAKNRLSPEGNSINEEVSKKMSHEGGCFENISVALVPGINIFLGENGTGAG
jgi:hypothetical protein